VEQHIESYGIEIVRMGFVVNIDEEDEATLKSLYKDAAYLRMTGGTPGYQQFAAARAMMGAGEGLAKGAGEAGASGAGEGLGLGVGFGMAQMFTQMARGGAVASGVACPSCRTQVPGGRFCNQCGAPLVPAGKDAARTCAGCGQRAAPEGPLLRRLRARPARARLRLVRVAARGPGAGGGGE